MSKYFRGARIQKKPVAETPLPKLLSGTVPLPEFIVHTACIAIYEYKISDKREFIRLLEVALDEVGKPDAKP